MPLGRGERRSEEASAPLGRGECRCDEASAPLGRGERRSDEASAPLGRGERRSEEASAPLGDRTVSPGDEAFAGRSAGRGEGRLRIEPAADRSTRRMVERFNR